MITLTGLNRKIKTSWTEVTAQDLFSIQADSPRAVIQALSTLTAEEVSRLSAVQVLSLYELVSFVEDLGELSGHLHTVRDLPDVDVENGSYERAELGRARMVESRKPYRLFPALAKIYFPDQKFTGVECMAVGAIINQALTSLFDRFKDLAGEEPNEDQEEAGIQALQSFGTYGIVESLAARYGCRPYEVYQWAAEEVYLDLLYQQTKAKYQDNLREIEKRKSKK